MMNKTAFLWYLDFLSNDRSLDDLPASVFIELLIDNIKQRWFDSEFSIDEIKEFIMQLDD